MNPSKTTRIIIMHKDRVAHIGKLAACIFALITTSVMANEQAQQQYNYSNEEAIVFETMDGIQTNAFSGYITVPENRSNQQSRNIKVHYVRFPATANKTGSPIVYLSGGPGGSGIDTAKYPNFRFPLFMALREHGDVIALDQRGTGLSKDTPTCRSDQYTPMNQVQSIDDTIALYKLAAKQCHAFWQSKGIDLLGYNTVESAQDLNELRQHLKAEKITLWGISYGSHLAFAAMKLFPERIDKVVIASAEGLNQTVKLPTQTDAYFSRLQDAINTQPEAAKQYPDIKGLIARIHQQLLDKPIKVTLQSKAASGNTLLFQKHHLQILASSMITDPQRYVSVLLKLYKSIDVGNLEILNGLLARGYFDENQISFEAMPLAMDIASGITAERLALVEQQAKTSLLGLMLNFPMPQLNNQLNGLDLGDSFRADPINNIPTLLLSGTLDGRTYLASQYEATSGLSALTKVTIENAGHNLFMSSPKVTQVIKQFLNDQAIKDKTISIDLPDFTK